MRVLFGLCLLAACGGDDVLEAGTTSSSSSTTVTAPADNGCVLQSSNTLRFDCVLNLASAGGVIVTATPDADAVTRIFQSDSDGTSHAITLWGMTENTDYTIVATDDSGVEIYSDVLTTGAVPSDIELSSDISSTATTTTDAVLFHDCNHFGMMVMLDTNGAVIWYQDVEDVLPGELVFAYAFTDDDTVLVTASQDKIVELSLGGDVLRMVELAAMGLDGVLHHEVYGANGYIYALFAYTLDGYVVDGVYVFDQDGDLVETLDSDDYYDAASVEQASMPPDQYWQQVFPGYTVTSHGNSVYASADGQLLLSWRFLNTVVSFNGDPTSKGFGDVNWVVEGQPSDAFDGEYDLSSSVTSDLTFEAPHNAQIGVSGALTLVDNGIHVTSRVLVIDIDTAASEGEIVGAYSLERQCDTQSSVYEIVGGSVLTTCSTYNEFKEFAEGAEDAHWTMRLDECILQAEMPPQVSEGIPILF